MPAIPSTKLAAVLSFVCGFASLSQEILWVRLYGFAKSSTPAAFGFVLCIYLVGIALGASAGARACRQSTDAALWRASVLALLLSAVLTPLLPALFAGVSASGLHHPLLDVTTIATASAVLSFVFPIAHHLGTRQAEGRRGRHFARVYTANVTGAALGPLVTGYLLLDILSLQSSFLAIALLQAVAAILLVHALRMGSRGLPFTAAGAVCGAGLLAAAATLEPHGLLRQFPHGGGPAHTVVENRHGVVTIFHGEEGDDPVYGGNVYDGRTNTGVERNTNGLDRPLLLGALHPQPRRVLMVGLSIGSWLAVVRSFPGVESIEVVEVNPGYLSAAQTYPDQAAALRDPRVAVSIDDGRRWLRQRPGRQFDLIIMNTTLHWRANASLLLSEQLLRQLRSHMAPGAILGFNATGSLDAFHTAAKVFPHAYRYSNFVYAADFDFRPRKDAPEALARYAAMQVGGRPLFRPNASIGAQYLRRPFATIAQDEAASTRRGELVTDENMLTEFRYGRRLYEWTDLFFLDTEH